MKDKLYSAIDASQNRYRALSDAVWEYAETAYGETKSAAVLSDYLEQAGFKVERGVVGIATAFTATYGEGHPHIGFLGEYDALANLSQSACTTQADPRNGQPGHGCGHNLLGVGALAACEAMKAYIDAGHPGRITYFGCPAEEGGSGKAFMARDGVFDDLDAALSWHPGSAYNVAYYSSLANYQVIYRFQGKAAHAAGEPHLGRSALDAVELMNVGVQFLREHIPTTARIHYAIVNSGGYSPNVVQPEASVLYLMRMTDVNDLPELYARVNDIAQGAALMTGTTVSHEFIKGCSNTVINTPLYKAMWANMEALPLPAPTSEEVDFGAKLRESLDNPTEGPVYADFLTPIPPIEGHGCASTDVGDVCWVCPTAYLYTPTWPREIPGHSWQATSCGKSDYAVKMMLHAAKVIAATAYDIFENPALLANAREDYLHRTNGKYNCPIPDGIKPQLISNIH